eukprot:3758108-Prymnesium_polylepis.1
MLHLALERGERGPAAERAVHRARGGAERRAACRCGVRCALVGLCAAQGAVAEGRREPPTLALALAPTLTLPLTCAACAAQGAVAEGRREAARGARRRLPAGLQQGRDDGGAVRRLAGHGGETALQEEALR